MINIKIEGGITVNPGHAVDNATGEKHKVLQLIATDPQSGIQVELMWIGDAVDKFVAQVTSAGTGIVIAGAGAMPV